MGQVIKNLGWGGDVLDARLGSASGADSNDPKFLDWDGENYVYLPGVTGNFLSVPDEAALDITGDLEVVMKIKPGADWNVLSGASVYKREAWWFYQTYNTINGQLAMMWRSGGSNKAVHSTVAVSANLGTAASVGWVKGTLDVDDGAGNHVVKFWTSPDGVTWTQLGTTVTTAGTTSIDTSTYEVKFGDLSPLTSLYYTGDLYRAIIKDGIDGTPVLDIDCSQIASGSNTSFTALTGQTVTINRSTSGRKAVAVTHPCWLFGTDDYMEVPARWVDAASGGLFLPGVAGNYASAPDSAAVSVTGDITIDCYAQLADWTPATIQELVSKVESASASGQRSYELLVTTGGNLQLNWSPDGGTTVYGKTSTVIIPASDGEAVWLRGTLDVDNGAAGNDVKFYTSADGVSWAQLGSTVTTAGTTSIYDGTHMVEIGSRHSGTSLPVTGVIYRARIYASADGSGSPVFDADFTGQAALATTFTEDSTNSATVTVNTSGSGYVATLVPASGYVQPTGVANFQPSSYSLLDFGASDSFTVLAVVRRWATISVGSVMAKLSNITSSNPGYVLYSSSSYSEFSISDGGGVRPNTDPGAVTAGTMTLLAGVRDVGADNITAYRQGSGSTPVTDTTTGSLANSDALRIARLSGGGTLYADMEFIAAAIWRRALTSGEIATLNSYFQGRA